MEQKSVKGRGKQRKIVLSLALVVAVAFILWSFYSLSSGRIDVNLAVVVFVAVVIFVILIISLIGRNR